MELRPHIVDTLAIIGRHGIQHVGQLWHHLGYRSDKTLDLPDDPQAFWTTISSGDASSASRALVDRWKSARFLFQLTNDEIPSLTDGQSALNVGDNAYQQGAIESFVFLAIELEGEAWSRTELSKITREINRAFPMPAIVAFKHGGLLSIAVIDRRTHKREASKDVIDAKRLSIIKDIRLENPHAAHVRILEDVALSRVGERSTPKTFRDLYESWMRVLSVKALNKRFYRELADWFFWANEEVKLPLGGGLDEKERNATGVIRLITRLMFVWFLKQRLPSLAPLFDEKTLRAHLLDLSPDGSTYYRAILQNLFFATLNTEPNNRNWASKSVRGSAEYLDAHAYRYREAFRNPDQALSLFADIPFLNGGLFECLDRLVTDDEIADHPELSALCVMEGKQRVQRVDGFSRRSENPLHVPNRLFFQSEPLRVDSLNEIYDTSGRDYKVRGLFAILNDYKFTIDENTPVEEEVALDPELLGKVFENLLASFNPETKTTARKQTGSFYTPREIVDYMVDESLHWYLQNAMSSAGFGQLGDKLRAILGYGAEVPELTAEEREALIEAIDNVRVLDPACGSGAFPIGALQKLVHILDRVDPKNERWYQAQLRRVGRLRKAAMNLGALDAREDILASIDQQEAQVRQAFLRDELNYMRKLFLIRNSIFGVDIQPIAVQISKLRIFISLLVSERIDPADRDNNFGIQALPNLETKFVAANTLVRVKPPKQSSLGTQDDVLDQIKRELKEVRESKFFPKNFAAKRKLIERDRALRSKLRDELARIGFEQESAGRIAEWDPDELNSSAQFFDAEWMFLEKDGFHIVIGNPPYLRVQGLQQTQPEFMPYYREHYKSASGSFDLYGLFVERALDFLSESGQLVYILPHKFFQASFAVPLRRLLNEGMHLRQVVRFGAEQVFDEATTYTCLLFLAMQPQSGFDLFEVKSLSEGRTVFDAMQACVEHDAYAADHLEAPTTADWDFSIGARGKTLARLMQHKTELGHLTRKIFQGIPTGADKVFVLAQLSDDGPVIQCHSKQLGRDVEIEADFVKPFLMGKDVHRYELPAARNVVLFPYEIDGMRPRLLSEREIKAKFPKAWVYLTNVQGILEDREEGRFANTWWQYSRPQNLSEFHYVKIMTPDICGRCEFTVDLSGDLYHTTTLYSLALAPAWEARSMYLLGLLNSKVMWFFMSATGTPLRGNFYRFKTEYLKPFPIPDSDQPRESLVETLVKVVMKLRAYEKDQDSLIKKLSASDPEMKIRGSEFRLAAAYFEQLIDAIVYELYFPEDFADPERRVSTLLDTSVMDSDIGAVTPAFRDRLQAPTASGILAVIADESLPVILMRIFRMLYEPTHAVRRAVHRLSELEVVQVIEEATK